MRGGPVVAIRGSGQASYSVWSLRHHFWHPFSKLGIRLINQRIDAVTKDVISKFRRMAPVDFRPLLLVVGEAMSYRILCLAVRPVEGARIAKVVISMRGHR